MARPRHGLRICLPSLPLTCAALLRGSLSGTGSASSAFMSVVGPGSKAHLRILKFLAADDSVSDTDPLLRSLVDKLPDSQIVEFVNSADVGSFWQQHVLKRYVTHNGTLPVGLAAGSWLPKLLITLPNAVIERYSQNLPPERLIEFIIRLGEARVRRMSGNKNCLRRLS